MKALPTTFDRAKSYNLRELKHLFKLTPPGYEKNLISKRIWYRKNKK